MGDEKGGHRGSRHPLEFLIGWWTLFAVCALLAALFVIGDNAWRIAVGAGLLAASMIGFYIATRLITKGYPDLKDD